jgi:dipeptidyl aminopeptidase/acylaminoacyl peptidase
LIEHGDKDALVPIAQSQEFYDALKRGGVEAQLHVVPGGDHGLHQATAELIPIVMGFFASHLKAAAASTAQSAPKPDKIK